MIVVLDTNVVLQALNQRHRFAIILNAWYAGRFSWALSTDILFEYREVIVRTSGAARWQSLERLLELAARHFNSVVLISPSFFFRSISADRDDDKFADSAITANADFIVTSIRSISATLCFCESWFHGKSLDLTGINLGNPKSSSSICSIKASICSGVI